MGEAVRMNEDEIIKKRSELMEQMYTDIAEDIAKTTYKFCEMCGEKEECWINPIHGVSKTVSEIITNISNSKLSSIATIKLIELIRKKQLEKGK